MGSSGLRPAPADGRDSDLGFVSGNAGNLTQARGTAYRISVLKCSNYAFRVPVRSPGPSDFDPFYRVAGFLYLEGEYGMGQLVRLAREPVVGWIFPLGGAAALRTGLGSLALRPGRAVSFRADYGGGLFRGSAGPGWRCLALLFRGEIARRYWHFLNRRFGGRHECPANAGPVLAARRLAEWYRREGGRDEFESAARAQAWLSRWHEYLERHQAPARELPLLAPDDPRLGEIATRSVKDLAAELGLSRSHLSTRLRKRWGLPPARLLRERRLKQAADLLAGRGELPLETVAASAGYRSASGFLRAFKARFGLTPGAYRSSRRQPARTVRRREPPAPERTGGREANALRDDVSREQWTLPYFKVSIREQRFAPHRQVMDLSLSAVLPRPCAVFTLAGASWFETRQGRSLAQAGTVTCYRQPVHARWVPDARTRTWHRIWVHFQGELAGAYYHFLTQRFGWWMTVPGDSAPARALRALSRRAEARRRTPALQASVLVYRWLLTLHAYLETHFERKERRPDVEGLASRHFEHEPLTMVEYARRLGYSRAHIARKLKQHWGITPGRRLREARMELAARELRTSDAEIRTVAARAGYRSVSSFIQRFRRHFGTTPRRYRRLHRIA